MTLTAEQSSNKAKYEAAPTAKIIDIIRTAMSEGCIRPCHVYDAVDELICRIQALENRPKRNCDVGTAEGQGERCLEQINQWRRKGEGKKLITAIMEWAQMPYEQEGGAK